MSAAGRGPRLGGKDDFYITPTYCVHTLLDRLPFAHSMGMFVEPCAGNGAIIEAFKSYRNRFTGNADYEKVKWAVTEIRAEEGPKLFKLAEKGSIGDFLTQPKLPDLVSVVISNPPYNLAREVIERARELYPDAAICMLLRLNFMGGQNRNTWLKNWVPDIYTLSKRPAFSQNKHGRWATDATEYGWFLWPNGKPRVEGTLRVLEMPA